jgi:hypothetical protein
MWKRFRLIAIMVCALCAFDSRAIAATIYAQLFPHTGEVRLRNKGTTPVSMVFYSIISANSALSSSPNIWRSIDNFYDVSGNGFVDSNGEWAIIEALSSELTEGALDIDGGSLAPQRSISLGQIWNPNATTTPDLIFEAREANEQAIMVVTELAVNGDYLPDGVVDQLDYGVWRQNYGSTTLLSADGNLDGMVDAADYLVWRKNVGLQLAAAGQAASLPSLSASAVPEPTAIVLLFAASGFLCFTRMRRSR